MYYDDRKFPAVIFSFVVIIFLFLAFYFNFLNNEIIIVDENFTNKCYEGNIGRINNIDYQYFNNKLELISIVGECEITKKFDNSTLIELYNDNIYTIIVPSNCDENLELTIMNNSNSHKNIKCDLKFIIDDKEETRLITLKPQKNINLKSNGITWNLN